MAELEKVIKALENCTDEIKCRDCPWETCETFCLSVKVPLDLAKAALSLLKAQEPRVMTIKELEETEEPVFIELKTKGDDDKALTCFGLLSELDNLAFHFIIDQWLLDEEPFCKIYGCELKRKEYNIQWRPWNKRPTIKQMKAVKWE